MIRCMDCFEFVQERVPGTVICATCYANRCKSDCSYMRQRPIVERHRAAGMARHQRRSAELTLARNLEREWLPTVEAIIKEA
jgi:hypothetical protein